MDTTQTTTHISLCTGYAGIDLGLKRCIPNLRTVAYSEIEAFACENLLARMEAGQLDPAPIWTDLKSFPWAEFSGLVDVLTGGYPCQPFSSAGKRLGAEDERHLWPYIASGIRILKPRICFFENVEGHITLGLSTVISDLEEMGYTTTWGIFSAAECGAPHQRKRVFICAELADIKCSSGFWPSRPGKLVNAEHIGHNAAEIDGGHPAGADPRWAQESQVYRQSSGGCSPIWPSRPGKPQHCWEPPRVVGDSSRERCQQDAALRDQQQAGGAGEERWSGTSEGVEHPNSDRCECNVPRDASQQDSDRQNNGISSETNSMGNAQGGTRLGRASGDERHAAQSDEAGGNRQPQPSLGGNTDGAACGLDYAELCVTCDNRTDELRLLGNGVVPATAEKAFRTLLKQLWT